MSLSPNRIWPLTLPLVVALVITAPFAAARAEKKCDIVLNRKELPNLVYTLTGEDPLFDGPNCLNATCLWHGVGGNSMYPSYTSPERFDEILGADFVKLSSTAVPRRGDILVFRGKSWPKRALHAAIYVDENTVWHKPSSSAEDTWEFADYEEVRLNYRATTFEVFRRRP